MNKLLPIIFFLTTLIFFLPVGALNTALVVTVGSLGISHFVIEFIEKGK